MMSTNSLIAEATSHTDYNNMINIALPTTTSSMTSDHLNSTLIGHGLNEQDADNAHDTSLQQYSDWYAGYHGYVSLLVCAVGIVGNVFNIVVLTRPNMAISSTNCILTALAVADLLTMMSYVPFAVQFYCLHDRSVPLDSGNTAGWTAFLLFHVHFSVTTHTASIWLGVLLSAVRCVYVRRSAGGAVIKSVGGGCGGSSMAMRRLSVAAGLGRTRRAVVAVYVFSVLVLLPNYMSLVVQPSEHAAVGSGSPIYDLVSIGSFNNSTSSFIDGEAIVKANFWVHAVVIKMLPCFLMLFFGLVLVITVRASERRAVKLRAVLNASPAAGSKAWGSGRPASSPSGLNASPVVAGVYHTSVNSQSTLNSAGLNTSKKSNAACRRLNERNRTTWMLVTIVILFLLTELPQGLLAVCSGVFERCFDDYYAPLGDTMDIVALVNNGVNFALYCTMSCRFRQTFIHLVVCRVSGGRPRILGGATGGASGVVGTGLRRQSECVSDWSC